MSDDITHLIAGKIGMTDSNGKVGYLDFHAAGIFKDADGVPIKGFKPTAIGKFDVGGLGPEDYRYKIEGKAK